MNGAVGRILTSFCGLLRTARLLFGSEAERFVSALDMGELVNRIYVRRKFVDGMLSAANMDSAR